jgi:hypothetical protein
MGANEPIIREPKSYMLPYHETPVTRMAEINPLIDNCKPQRVHLENEKTTELKNSIDEMLEPSARHRVTSYQEAIRMIKQFTYIINDCNFMVEPEN